MSKQQYKHKRMLFVINNNAEQGLYGSHRNAKMRLR